MGAELRVALIGVIVASVGNQTTFARAQTIAPSAGPRWTEVLTMRLIDADDLGVGRCSKDILPAAYCAGWNGLINLLQAAPTVDAVPVVRCEDCIHWDDDPDTYG